MKLNNLYSWLKPTVPKIVLYTFLAFIVPTYLYNCNDTGCHKTLTWFAGYLLLTDKTAAQLTFIMLLLMFILAYLASSLLIAFFKFLKNSTIPAS